MKLVWKKFTLLELLIVCAVLAILLSMLLPSLGRSREKARRAVCLSNLKQIYYGGLMHSKNSNGSFPDGHVSMGNPGTGDFSISSKSTREGHGKLIAAKHIAPEVVYCPSLDNAGRFGWHVLNGRNPLVARDGGFQKKQPVLQHNGVMGGWMRLTTVSNYAYRSTFGPGSEYGSLKWSQMKRYSIAANIYKHDASRILWGDHFIMGYGRTVHKDGYNFVQLSGAAKWHQDTLGVGSRALNVNSVNYRKQEEMYRLFDE